MEPFQVLPRKTELSPGHTEFLDRQFRTREDLITRAPLLLTDLTNSFTDSEANLINLQRNLTKPMVSWISCFFRAKSSLANLNHMLENLSLRSSLQGIPSRKNCKILGEELPQLEKCLKRIENIRKYMDTALQLEALVGDLEDAAYTTGNQNSRNMFSRNLLTPLITTDFEAKQERLIRAIKVMNNIEDVLVDVDKIHPQWSHLLESVDVRVDKALAVVRPQILADHRALLASLGWPPKLSAAEANIVDITSIPNPLVLMEGDKRKFYSQSFSGLCALQHMQRRREYRKTNFGQKECIMRLWAIDELVSPIASRMEYHFSKWVEQPEFMFALVYKITRDFIVGVDDVLQPLIDKGRLVSLSAREAWVSTMVQMLSGFLSKTVVSVLAKQYRERDIKPEVISSWIHLIDHATAFDKRMRLLVSSEIHYFVEEVENDDGLARVMSVLSMFCDRPDWLKIWAKIELKDAWKKLKVEVKDERTWLIDEKSGVLCDIGANPGQFWLASREDYKAPLVAEHVIKITWEMIERCQTLPAVLPRIRFIRSSAGKFIWHFLSVLVWHDKNIELILDYPYDSLIKKCGSINAARYVESKLQQWGDDVKFLEMTIAESNSDINGNDDGANNNSFFWEEILSLSQLETNLVMDIITAVLHHFEALSSGYLENKNYFEYFGSNSVTGAVSANIVEALDGIRSQLNILKLNLNPKDLLDLWRGVADGVDRYISSSISNNGIQFSSEGINQFEADMQALLLVFQPFCARPEAFFPGIKETLKLLKMSEKDIQFVTAKGVQQAKCLNSFGIVNLTPLQVDKILMNRIFVS
ncbi:RINT1-like protein MAG2L isoform X1 [Euphorbia lathyris]|uniref:RINT1-like protein MAG2L isoform X1 n=2 Tax=Euphorbia lathyris TaxID=212925 RepID=UPI00331395C2